MLASKMMLSITRNDHPRINAKVTYNLSLWNTDATCPASSAWGDCHKFTRLWCAPLCSRADGFPTSGIKIVRSFLRYYSNCPVSFNDQEETGAAAERDLKKSPRERSGITNARRYQKRETGVVHDAVDYR